MKQAPQDNSTTEHALYLRLFVSNGGGWSTVIDANQKRHPCSARVLLLSFVSMSLSISRNGL